MQRVSYGPFQVITNGNMSPSVSPSQAIVSQVTIIKYVSLASYAISWSGSSPVGTLFVEVSNDYSENSAGQVVNPGTWNSIPSLQQAISGSPGNGYVELTPTAAYAVRLRYSATSGTGTMQAFIVTKSA